MRVYPNFIDYLFLIDSLGEYTSPKSKLTAMIKSKELLKIRRGLFVDPKNLNINRKSLANKIYGPSYISFEYALSFHGLIPERVETISSASMDKNKNKIFKTPLGVFTYANISSTVFPYGIERHEEAGSPYLIASPEKALCDSLSKIGSITSLAGLSSLLFEDLRIEKNDLQNLSLEEISIIAPLYRKKTTDIFLRFMGGIKNAQCRRIDACPI